MTDSTTKTYFNVLTATTALAPGTKNNRYRGIRNFVGYLTGVAPSTIDLSDLDVELIREHLTIVKVIAYLNILKVRGKKFAEIAEARYSLIMLGRLMAEHGFIDVQTPHRLRQIKLPTVEAGRRTSTRLDKVQIRHLFAVYPTTPEIFPIRRTRNWAMILLMLLCGLRAGELSKIRWGDLREVDGYATLTVHGKYSKLRVVKLPERVIQALNVWRALHPVPKSDIFVFVSLQGSTSHTPLSYAPLRGQHVISSAVEEAARIAQLPHLTPHDLRRTFARNAYLAGASIELIRQTLGHNSATMTEHYIKPPIEFDRSATDIWSDMVGRLLPDAEIAEELSIIVPNSSENAEKLGMTRQEAADYLRLSVTKWDRIRKKYGIHPWKTISGMTKPFNVFHLADVESLQTVLTIKKGQQ